MDEGPRAEVKKGFGVLVELLRLNTWRYTICKTTDGNVSHPHTGVPKKPLGSLFSHWHSPIVHQIQLQPESVKRDLNKVKGIAIIPLGHNFLIHCE